MNKKSFYITTTLPYVNSNAHVGHAMEFVRADILARYHRLLGDAVFFNTGTDEHGLKIYQKAMESGETPQAYVDRYAAAYRALDAEDMLNISYDNFIRTTDAHHINAAQEFWKRCAQNGDIYKKSYRVKYCVGCELEKTDSDLVDGKCPDHPNKEIEIIEEENYFFRFSNYQEKLLKLYAERPDFVMPEGRMNEIRAFVERGLQDFSISRLKTKMPWGVPVPGDDDQVMYVWFDALVNYVAAIGWPNDMEKFSKFWPVVQIAGKDNLRQQSSMWQAMLMSAGIAPSEKILINGFVISGGQKMSKTVGNIIDPLEVMKTFGGDALRYYVAGELPQFEDGDMTMDAFKEAYTAQLVNGIGNLSSRIMKMFTEYQKLGLSYSFAFKTKEEIFASLDAESPYRHALDNFEIHHATRFVWSLVNDLDKQISTNQPFKKIKSDDIAVREATMQEVAEFAAQLNRIAALAYPIIPKSADKILAALQNNEMPAPLFPRI